MSKFNTCTMRHLITALVLASLATSLSLCEGLVQQHRQHFRFLPSVSSHQGLQNKNASTPPPPPPSPLSAHSSVVLNDNNKSNPVFAHYATKNEDITTRPQGGILSLLRLFKRFLRMLTNALTLKNDMNMHFYRKFLWPGSQPDKSFTEPLPPGELGCPFFGVAFNVFSQFNIKKGVNAADFDQPRFRFVYAFLSPMAIVTGKKNVNQILNSEFDENGTEIATFFRNEEKLLGGSGILFSKDKDEHSFLRRLIGNAMTPASISIAVPQLQQLAIEHVDNMLDLSLSTPSSSPFTVKKTTIIGEDIFHDFTLAVAGKIILGLDLTKDEEISFKEELNNWTNGLLSLPTLFFPWLRFTKPWKARKFLVEIIEKKVMALKERGPDGSTLSAMVFATDDDHDDEDKGNSDISRRRQKALSHNQIIDNVLFLMLAGSETSASTLTNCLLLLGLHPQIWKRVVQEQDILRKTHGESLTKEQLDNECPYLEAVIKETMRIKPISGGQYRRTKATMVVGGNQLPKGWPIVYNIRKTHLLDSSTWLKDGSHMDIMTGFKPERWFDGDTCPKDGNYMPFGSGPRYCLGSTLAMAEMKVFLAIMARKLDFDIMGVDVENMKWKKEEVIAVPKDGVLVSVRPSDTSR